MFLLEFFEDNKKLLVGSSLLTVLVLTSAFLVADRKEGYQVRIDNKPNVESGEFGGDFLNTFEKKEPKKEVKEEPSIKERITQRILIKKPEKRIEPLKKTDLTENKYEEKRILKEQRAKLLLAKLNKKSASQVWASDPRFEETYKDQSLHKLRAMRNKKDVPSGSFGNIEQFCALGEDCLTSSKPTLLAQTVLAGFEIPVILKQDIVSDIATNICTAQVTQDVTGFHGNNILIPRNSIANCKMVPVKDISQERIQLIFTDIITPNGVRIQGAFAGADMTGAEGVQGVVNTRLLERVGFPLLTASIPITMAYTLPSASTEDEDRRNAAINGIVQATSPIIQKEFDRNLNTLPRITIEKGTLMNVKSSEHLVFKKIKEGFFMPTWQAKGTN